MTLKHIFITLIPVLLLTACSPLDAELPDIVTFDVEAPSPYPGDPVTLTWYVTGDALQLTLQAVEPVEQPPVDVSGRTSFTVNPTATTVYALTAANAEGSDTETVTVDVPIVDPPL